MAVMYSTIGPLEQVDPVELSIRLTDTLAEAISWLEDISDRRAGTAPSDGKWCAKEVIGHLIDSAVNNLQRFVLLDIAPDAAPYIYSQPYEQDDWVKMQHYREKNWVQILTMWIVLNEHLAWTMRSVNRLHLGRLCIFPEDHMTFGFLMDDYIGHMKHHLQALRVWL